MSYLELLKKDKINKSKFEQEQITLKQVVLDIQMLYTEFDGNFLEELQNFIKDYKEKQL